MAGVADDVPQLQQLPGRQRHPALRERQQPALRCRLLVKSIRLEREQPVEDLQQRPADLAVGETVISLTFPLPIPIETPT